MNDVTSGGLSFITASLCVCANKGAIPELEVNKHHKSLWSNKSMHG